MATSDSGIKSLEEVPLNSFHRKLAIYSAGGPFLDGYILSIIGVALIQATPQLKLNSFWEGMIGASALIGIFFGGFVGGWLADKLGRQTLYTLDLLAMILCSIAQYWAGSAPMLFICRLLIGAAVGADYPIATALLTEFTPRRYRGPFVGGLMVMWFVGAAIAYGVGELLLQLGPDGWRWMLASAALPASVFVFMRHGTPESPRWLAYKGRDAEARAVLRQVYGPIADALPSLPQLIEAGPASRIPVRELFRGEYGARVLFVSIFWTCSIVPLFAVYAFGPKIMVALGMDASNATLGTTVITLMFLLGCALSLLVINRMGRRSLLLNSFFWSGLALLALGLFPNISPILILTLFCIYAVFIGGSQVLQFIYPNELFPTEIRGAAVGLASSLTRIGAAVGVYLVPIALEKNGIGNTLLIGAAITAIGYALSYKMAPETTHKTLEEAAAV
jgi:MFS transporter, putative metabolite transport protein